VQIRLFPDTAALGVAAADAAARILTDAIAARGSARLIAATGASQFQFLAALTARSDIDWSKVELFHLDEYVGISAEHPASFRRYLLERLIGPAGITRTHLIDAEHDPQAVCRSLGARITAAPIDVAFVGIGENGHLAFNDPPADFDTREPYLVVALDEACRRQQVGEGWFGSLADVPRTAVSMSCRQILAARTILVIVPDARKAEAVRGALEGPVTPLVPASILQEHPDVTVFLDPPAASRLARPPGLEAPASIRHPEP
jgi:glucosamine-6-phosphate deaminase